MSGGKVAARGPLFVTCVTILLFCLRRTQWFESGAASCRGHVALIWSTTRTCNGHNKHEWVEGGRLRVSGGGGMAWHGMRGQVDRSGCLVVLLIECCSSTTHTHLEGGCVPQEGSLHVGVGGGVRPRVAEASRRLRGERGVAYRTWGWAVERR